jgi:hypothetical protein
MQSKKCLLILPHPPTPQKINLISTLWWPQMYCHLFLCNTKLKPACNWSFEIRENLWFNATGTAELQQLVKTDVKFRSIYNFHSDKKRQTFKWWASFWYLHHLVVWCSDVSHASAGIWTNSDALEKEEVRLSETLAYLVTTRCGISTLKNGTFLLKADTFNHYMETKAIRKT